LVGIGVVTKWGRRLCSGDNLVVRNVRRGFATLGVVCALLVMPSCGVRESPTVSVAQSVTAGAPDGVVREPGNAPVVTWVEPGEQFAVVTWGSSTCPLFATDVVAGGNHSVTVTFGPSPRDACTDDLEPTTHVFDLPGVITERPITVVVDYDESGETHTLTLN
jgi:hypothetical protein